MKYIFPFIIIFLVGSGLVLMSISIFHPLSIWDESRLIVNAIEMSQNKNYFVTYYNGAPDLWNTKPPLFIWILVLLIKLFGYSEWVFRILPITCFFSVLLIVYKFCIEEFNDRIAGILAVISLFFSVGFNGFHSSLTADYDILLSLFSILSFIHYYKFINNNKSKNLFFSIVFLALAVLTKGVAGLFIVPGFFFYTIYKKKLWVILANKNFYISVFLFLLVTCGFYFLRESQNKGYLEAVFFNELGGRFNSSTEGHSHPFYYYFVNFFQKRYLIWFGSLLVCSFLFVYKRSKSENKNDFFLFSWICLGIFFFIISFSKSKLEQYDLPTYPIMSLLLGLSFSAIHVWNFKHYKLWSLESVVIILIIFSASFYLNSTYNYLIKNDEFEKPGKHIIHITKSHSELKNYSYLSDHFNTQQFLCYKYISKFRDNINIAEVNINDNSLLNKYIAFSTEYHIANFFKIYQIDTAKSYINSTGFLVYVVDYNHHGILTLLNSKYKEILKNKEWYSDVKKRSFENNIPISVQLRNDAVYCLTILDKLVPDTYFNPNKP